MKYSIEQLRQAWLDSALDIWQSGVVDENQSPAIKRMFQACGWGFWVNDADGYRNNARHAWCGIFQAYAALRVGRFLEEGQCVAVSLEHGIAKNCLPSTARMTSMHKWDAAGVTAPTAWIIDNRAGGVNPEFIQPGMVATIAARTYGDPRDSFGGHFVLVESYDPATETVCTVEGNAVGELADGTWGEGVVRRRGKHARKLADFRRVYEFSTEHFDDMGAE